MDEEEKPFPIEFIVILMLVAIANDIAEIFFDLLDFTGVGVAGEAIMEPADFVLDLFFTGIFWWKVGAGGGTITQYIGDLLEPLLIPGRTISVGLGIWIANNPNSAVGKLATEAASLESGNAAGALGEAEETAAAVSREAAVAEKNLQNEAAKMPGTEQKTGEKENSSASTTTGRLGPSENRGGNEGEGEGRDAGEGENAPEKDIFKNPYDNPIGTAGEELNEPSEEKFHEGEGFKSPEEAQTSEPEPRRGIHLVSRRPAAPAKKDEAKEVVDVKPPEALEDAA